MNIFLKILLSTLLMSLFACKGQNKKNMVEKFDFDEYSKRTSAVHIFHKNDTTYEMVYNPKRGGHIYITLPNPFFF